MKQILTKIFGPHYSTTLAGLGAAVCEAWNPIIHADSFNLQTGLPVLAKAAFLALIGYYAPSFKALMQTNQPTDLKTDSATNN